MATPRRIMKPMPLRGRKTAWPADSIGQEYSPNCLNVRFKFGEARPAPGRAFYSGSVFNEPVHRIETFSLSSAVSWVILMTRTHLYRRGNNTPGDIDAWFPINGTFPLGGPRRWSVASGEDRFFFCKGNTEIAYWDGVGADNYDLISNVAGFEGIGTVRDPITDAVITPGTGISAQCLAYFNERLVAANVVENGVTIANRIRWAQNGDFRKWDNSIGLGAGFLDLNDSGAEPIVAIEPLEKNLVIYRKHSMGELVPTGTLAPTHIYNPRVHGFGCNAPFTVASNGQAHFFLGTDKNVWTWDGQSLTPVGMPIQEELAGIAFNDSLVQYFGTVLHNRFEYWLIICDQGRQSYDVFVYDYLRNFWTRDSFSNLYAVGEVEIPLPVYTWLNIPGIWTDWYNYSWNDLKSTSITSTLGGRTDGATMRIDDQFVDDYYTIGSIIDRVVETEDMYIDTPWDLANVVRLLLVYEYLNSEPFEVAVSFNRGQSWITKTVIPERSGYSFTEFVRTGNVVRFRFRENNANGTFRWRRYMFEILPEGDFIGTTT